MATNPGTQVIAPIRPFDSADTFPSAYANEIKGGHHQVASILERDGISADRRIAGMLCSVIGDQTYQLDADLLTWSPFSAGAGLGSALILDASATEIPGKVYNDIIALAAYIDATPDAPNTVLVQPGLYSVEQTIIFRKPVILIGVDPQSCVFEFTFNAANMWVSTNEQYPYYSKYCIYFGDTVDQGTYYQRARIRFAGTCGVSNITVRSKSQGLSHVVGYFDSDSPQHYSARNLRLEQVDQPAAIYGSANQWPTAMLIETDNSHGSDESHIPASCDIQDIHITAFSKLSGLVSCDGTVNLVGNADTKFTSELFPGCHLFFDYGMHRVVSISDDQHAVVDTSPGTFTDSECTAYHQLGNGISVSMFDNESPTHLKINTIHAHGVMGRVVYSSGFESQDIGNIHCLGCGWGQLTAQGDNAYVRFNYCGFTHLHDITEWRWYVPHNTAQSGYWNLVSIPNTNGETIVENIALKSGNTTNSLYSGIYSAKPVRIQNVTISNYYIAGNGIHLLDQASGSSIHQAKILDTACTNSIRIESISDIRLGNCQLNQGIFTLAVTDVSILDSMIIGSCLINGDRFSLRGCDFSGSIALSTVTESSFIGNRFGGNVQTSALSGCVFEGNTFAALTSDFNTGTNGRLNGNLFILNAANAEITVTGGSEFIGNVITDGASFAINTGDPIITVSNGCICNGNRVNLHGFLLQYGVISVAGGVVNGNWIDCELAAAGNAAITDTGGRSSIVGNILRSYLSPVPAAIELQGNMNVAVGNVCDGYSTKVLNSGSLNQVANNA